MEMTGKVALVTGVTSSIGKPTPRRFAEADAPVILTGRKEELFKETSCYNSARTNPPLSYQ